MTLSTHVLDASTGRPAAKVPVTLDRRVGESWERVSSGVTDDDGRCPTISPDELEAAAYRLVFDTATHFAAAEVRGFYPEVTVVFTVTEPQRHHHVPLLLSPFAYSTYRGS